MTTPDYRCSVCKNKYARNEDQQRKHQERKGCFSMMNTGLFYRGDGPMKGYSKFKVKRCFSIFYSNQCAELINMLPSIRPDLESPAKIADLCHLVDNLIEERNLEQQKIMDRLKRGSR
jgi:hypothetical protein